MEIKPIAYIHTPFRDKFGLPRQPLLVPDLWGEIIFEPEYRNPEALRELRGYSHIWLVWGFHKVQMDKWSPTVRPPRLGGNKRAGVFATRSPFRPNPIGLSVVRLDSIEQTGQNGSVLRVAGADLLDGTPIYDIKPYLPHVDSIPLAESGFAGQAAEHSLDVVIPDCCLSLIPECDRRAVQSILSQDPRPGYHTDPERVYGMFYGDSEIFFKVCGNILTVTEVRESQQ